MKEFLIFVSGSMFGGLAGVVMMCLCKAAGDADKNMPEV